MNTKYWVLDGHTPVPIDDVKQRARKFEDTENRRVGLTDISDDCRVSTVFLGLDRSWGDGPPMIFETRIFGGPHNQYQERYSTWEEAEAGHAAAVKLASEGADMESESVRRRRKYEQEQDAELDAFGAQLRGAGPDDGN